MATSYTTTIKNLKPQGWSRQTVADGQALNNSFLEPTHQKDLKLAEGLDATNDRIDSVNTQMTTLGQRVSNAESTVANIGEDVQAYDQEIAQLNSNLQIVSAAEGELATSLGTVTEKLNEHKNLVSVDSTTIAGDGSAESPYTVIGGGGGGVSKVYVPNVDGGNLSYTLSAASAAESQIGPWDIKGPKGNDGVKGNDATPLTAATATIAGGTQVTISYTSGGDPLAQFNVLSGASGDPGFSPTVVTTDIPVSEEFPAGGTEVTITDSDGPHTFNISNGLDGQGATVNLLGGEGIEVNKTGANYTISVSADYSGVAVASAKNWVEAQGYILSGALNPENSVSGKWRNGQYYDFGLKASAENALADVVNKVSIPSNQTANVYVWNAIQNPSESGWKPANDVLPNALATSFIRWSALQLAFSANNGLSASYGDDEDEKFIVGLATSGIDANKQYAWTTTGWEVVQTGGGGTVYDIVGNNGVSAEKDTANNQYIVGLSGSYVNISGDTMTGPLVVNSTTNHPFVGISQRGDSDDFAIFGATRKKSNNNFGTTWLGVGQDGQGVLKNIPDTSTSAATEPASNGAYTQITFSQNNNAVPSVDINAKLNGSDHNYKSVVVPQQSYNSMSAFDATNGPNYMLRKLSDGSFDIGACVINVTEVPTATEANTYYFVYDLV